MQDSRDDRNDRARNIADVKTDLELQQNTESSLSPNITDSDAGSFNSINRNNEQNQKNAKDNLMPNPDDFDEGDDQDSSGKGRTPGL